MSNSLTLPEVIERIKQGGQLVAISTRKDFSGHTGWLIAGEVQYPVTQEVFEQIFKMDRSELPLQIVRTFREGKKHGIVYQLEQRV